MEPPARQTFRGRITEKLLYVPPEVPPLHFYGRALLQVCLVVWGWQFMTAEYDKLVGGFPEVSDSFMHDVDLVFHEAGHVIFVPFGRFMTVLGGTLNQWLIPTVVMIAFVVKARDTFGASVGLWWLGQSLMDAAPYINDARAGKLILLGGATGSDRPGYHDWHNILGQLGWLKYDHAIAGMVDASGTFLMLLSFIWAAILLRRQYTHLVKRR